MEKRKLTVDELKKEIGVILELAKDTDYACDSDYNEYPIDVLQTDFAIDKIVELFQEITIKS